MSEVTPPCRWGKGTRIVTHVCNDIGGRGKGFVLELSRRRPEPEAAYRRWRRERAKNDFGLGAVQYVQVERHLWIAHMIGQRGTRTGSKGVPVRYEAMDAGLTDIAAKAAELGASVHMPRIGCGLAGGKWSRGRTTDIRPARGPRHRGDGVRPPGPSRTLRGGGGRVGPRHGPRTPAPGIPPQGGSSRRIGRPVRGRCPRPGAAVGRSAGHGGPWARATASALPVHPRPAQCGPHRRAARPGRRRRGGPAHLCLGARVRPGVPVGQRVAGQGRHGIPLTGTTWPRGRILDHVSPGNRWGAV